MIYLGGPKHLQHVDADLIRRGQDVVCVDGAPFAAGVSAIQRHAYEKRFFHFEHWLYEAAYVYEDRSREEFECIMAARLEKRAAAVK